MNKPLHKASRIAFRMLIAVALSIAGTVAHAQVSSYVLTPSSGTYTAIVGGTATSLVAAADDDISTAFNIGFNFVYNGITYTQVMACSNGPLLFGTGRTQTATNTLSTATASRRPGVAALWDDLQCTAGVTYQVSGSSPNRVLTVQWANMEWDYAAAGAVISFQVKLYETTNRIEFIYDQAATAYSAAGSTGGASIGIMGVTSTDFISLQDVTAAPATSITTSKNDIITKPATGQIYTFSPPACSGTPTAGTIALSGTPGCGATAINITGTGGTASAGISYQWQSSPDSLSWGPLLIGDTLASYSGASVYTNTYFRRLTICTNSGLSAGSAGVLVKPVYGGTTASTGAVCGDSITVSLTNHSTGASYQWESSFDSLNWTPVITTSTSSSKIVSPTTVMYYRATVMCSFNAASATSLAVKVLPILAGTTSITANFCNDSTTITVTGGSTGPALTYQWESSPDSLSWSSVPGATLATYKFALPGAFMFYRRITTCGSSTATSLAIRVTNNCAGFGYSVSRSTGITYNSIQATGSNFVWNAPASGDDDRSNPVYFPAGFNFSYNGAVRPAFYVCLNGWLSFDTTVYSTAWTNDLTVTSPKYIIAPFWEDMVTLGNTVANKSYIKYRLTGTAPNRVMTVEWAEMERFQYASPSLNFQVKFYEGTNNIEYIYGKMQPFDGSGTGDFNYSIGMTGGNPAVGQKLSQQLENSTNFSASLVNNALPLVPVCNSSLLFTAGGPNNYTNVSAVPSNDSSLTPVVLTVNAVPCTDACGTYYTSKSATGSNRGVAPPTSTPDDDVWFKFTAPISGQVNISVFSSSGYNPAFQVMTSLFDSAGLGSAWFRDVNTTALEQVTATGLVSGNDYLIRVYHSGTGFGSTSGAFSICVNEVIPPPANDDTATAVVLSVNTTACSPTAGTTLGGSASPIAVCGGLADDDVWYKFVANNATDTIRVQGSGTFRAHVQILNRQMTSLYCQNTGVNAGEVVITTNNLLLDSTYFIRIYHTNAGTASANFTVCVTGIAATVPAIITGTITNLTLSSVTILNSNIGSNGGFPVTRSGVLLSSSPLPTIITPGVIDSMTNPLVTGGNYSINMANLFSATAYYARAYAINAVGVGYGADSMFITPAAAVVPTINTVAASGITAFAGTMSGNITSDGGASVTASGIVFSTTINPVLFNFGVVDSTTNPVVTSGAFSKGAAGLTPNTKYYFRAYATNSAGTAYGLNDSFSTSPVISSLPYTQNFDLPGNTGWTSVATGGANDWVMGTPAKTVITAAYSGANCWITKLVGNYINYHNAAVVSPQFDLTTYPANAILRFKHKFVTEANCCDGGWVEVSINGGTWTKVENSLGTGPNFNTTNATGWYNYAIGAGNVWNGTSTTSHSSNVNGWITSMVPLPGTAGQSDVKIRFVFLSDVSAEYDGWALDDIEVFAPTAPSLLTGSTTNITYQSATLGGNITNNNGAAVTASGIVFSTSAAPVRGGMNVVDSATNPLVTGGAFNLNVAGLGSATTYYYRSYAVNAVGTSYGADSTFVTNAAAVAPTVNANAATNITTTTARLSGTIATDGGALVTASGMVYSTTPNPVLLGSGVVDVPTSPVVTTGTYQLNVSGLSTGTMYYYRAYATNMVGTSYSTQDSLMTDAIISVLPYNQGFETTLNTSWKTEAIAGTNQWVLTTPSKTFLSAAHGGTKAWITKAAGVYDNNTNNALISPQFDLSASTEDPVLRFYHKFVSETGWDGIVVEATFDGVTWNKLDPALGAGGNFNTAGSYAWYNNTSVNGPIVPNKFSSINSGDGSNLIYSSHVGGWVESATRITGAAGQDTVIFRFRFGSDGSGQYEGWLIDDIEVVQVAAPSITASTILSTPANTSANVSWTNGNGVGRIVVARLTATAAVAPTNWTTYAADAAFGSGSVTGTGNYVVYNGTGSSVNVTGLTALTGYTFDVYEFNGKYMHVKFGNAGTGSTTTTPVKLVSFAATNNNGDGYLTWSTSSEKNNAGFNIERSIDGKHFEYVSFVKGAGTSNNVLRYAYSDNKVFKATGAHKVYYRLKQLDRDGKFEYSNVVSVSEEGTGNFAVKAFPVPFVKDMTLAVTAGEQGSATVDVMDIQGRVIAKQVIEVVAGENTVTLSSLNDLQAGVYFIRVVEHGNTQTVRVVKAN